MKVTYFQQIPYRHLPDDFEQRFESVVTTPYHEVTTREHVVGAFRQALDELMHAARAGFDGLTVTEHGQSSYDMAPNPNIIESALAYATETENIDTAIYPMGRSLGKALEPLRVAEELAMIDSMSRGRLVSGFPVGLAYDANINNGVPPAQTRQRFDENLELVLKAWAEPDVFTWNGRFSQHSAVNIWPRPVQQNPLPPVWITGIGNPRTMQMAIEREFGFNYAGWFGFKVTGRRIFDRFWEIADRAGKDANPYRLGFMQAICVADTDAKAESLYAKHAEYFFRKGLGSIPMERLALPGGIDIRGVEAIMRDPGDFGIYNKMRTATFAELLDSGSVICGSPDTVAEQLLTYAREYRIGNLHAMLQFGSMPHELTKDNIDLFSQAVLPRLQQLWTEEGHQHHWWPERLGGQPLPASESATLTGAHA